jgi:rod shape-determining protein MreC
MLSKPHYLALGAVVLLTVIVLSLPSRTAARFKLAIGSLFLPLFGFASATQTAAEKAGNAVLPRKELIKELEQTRQENQRLKIELRQSAELGRENERLRKLLGFQKPPQWKLRPAVVIARDPANWWRTVQIDRGSRDGVMINLPVLSPEGHLVGKISEVSATRSQVLLLGDPKCRVGAMVVEGKNQVDHGVVLGPSSVLDPSLVQLGHLSRSGVLKPGQWVITSGLAGIFPKGITIGQIVDFQTVDFGFSTEARVKLAVNLNALEEVWIKMP